MIEHILNSALPAKELRRNTRYDQANRQCNTRFKGDAELTTSDESYTLHLSLPSLVGRRLEELSLSVTENIITLEVPALSFAQDQERKTQELTPLIEEIPAQPHKSRYRLPRDVKVDQIQAQLSGDQLVIHLPKREPTRHTVPITLS